MQLDGICRQLIELSRQRLPSGDDGLSVFLLKELVRLKPNLSRHVIVIDAPSTNRKLMQSLGKLADAIVVWGGDEAIRAVREMAVVRALGKHFLALLEEESLIYPELSLEIRGKVGIALFWKYPICSGTVG